MPATPTNVAVGNDVSVLDIHLHAALPNEK